SEAAQYYQQAIEQFRLIGWNDQIKYIEEEIRKMNILEQQKRRELELQKLLEQKEKQRQLEEKQRAEEKKKEELKELDEINKMIRQVSKIKEEKKKQEEFLKEQEKKILGFKQNEKLALPKKPLKLSSLRDSMYSAVEEKLKELEEKKTKIKNEMDEFKEMIKKAAKKASENKNDK
ncbi:MAG: hypothetical protein ACTSU2_00460, partial [Promethearchaeota archaeon]